jgi:hypothetical protein
MSEMNVSDGAFERRGIGAGAGAASGTSLVAAIAAFCCVGPWAVVLFGVPGAIAIARFEPYRPYLLATSAVLLGWAFWRTYRLRQACLSGVCAKGPSPWLIAALIVASGLWLFALVAPYVADMVARSMLP